MPEQLKDQLDIANALGQIEQDENEKNKEIVQNLPDNIVEWQKQCVCDFESNNNTHSNDCKARLKEILGDNE